MGLKLFTINMGNHKVKVLSYPTDMLNILLEYDGLKNKRWAQSVHTLTVLNLEKKSNLGLILREKSLAIIYNGVSHRRFLKHKIFLIGRFANCRLFENDLMATHKWSKETKSNFIARI